MATTFDEIENLALVTIQDYKLDKLYAQSQTDFSTFLAGLTIRAVPLFTNCSKTLDYNITTKTFTSTFDIFEKDILATLFIQIWLERVQQNLTQIASTMTPSDSKRTGVSSLVKERQYLIDVAREKNSQKMCDYSTSQINYADWGNGIFY